ncbi:MAG: NBR1-Ig-like domain-containing protein [Anaerolineales bacterium]
MNQKKILPFGMLGVMAMLLGGCGLFPSAPTKFQFPTPNRTMSKLFEVPTTKPRTTAGVGTGSGLSTATVSPTAMNCTNSAQLAGESVPNGTFMSPSSAFMKTWTLKNTGTCLWGKGYAMVFDRGDPMGAPDEIPLTASVPPGAVYTFAVNLVSPAADGKYTGYWKLQTPQRVRFGIEPDGLTAFVVSITVTRAPVCAAQDRRPAENGTVLQATYAVNPPVLDSKLADWESPLSYSLPHVSLGETENGARLGLRWDQKYLYFALQVNDSVFAQETSGAANLLQGDAVEILLDMDLRGDYCDSIMSGDDYQLGISPGYLPDPSLQSPAAYLFYPLGKKGPVTLEISAILTKSPDPKGWVMEARIPWGQFGVSPAGGESYGFVFSVSDNDQSGAVNQDGIISTSPRRTSPPNPMLWGTLQIIAG